MSINNVIIPAFTGATLGILVSTTAHADEPYLPTLPDVQGFTACHSSYNFNLRARCNIEALSALGGLYNQFDQAIIDADLTQEEKEALIDPLQSECGMDLLNADGIIRNMRKNFGIFLIGDLNDGKIAVQNAADICLSTFKQTAEEIGEEPDLDEASRFFSPSIVR